MVDENVMSKKFMSFIDKQEIKWFELFYHIYNNKNKNILSELYTKGIKIINLFKLQYNKQNEIYTEIRVPRGENRKNVSFRVM